MIGPRGNFDPTFSANFSWDRVESPLNTQVVSGIPVVIVPSTVLQTRFQEELPIGTSFAVSYNIQRQSSTQEACSSIPRSTGTFPFSFTSHC